MNQTEITKNILAVCKSVSGSHAVYYDHTIPNDATYPFIQVYMPVDNVVIEDGVWTSNNIVVSFNIYDRLKSDKGKTISPATINAVSQELITKMNNLSAPTSESIVRNELRLDRPVTVVDEFWQKTLQYDITI